MENRIKQIMASVLKVDVTDINEESSPDNLETWDSLSQMNLILSLEEEFAIEFTNEEIIAMVNYKSIYIIIKKKLNF